MENRIYPIMVSTLRMKNGGFEVDYPQVSCLSNPDAQEIINRTIMENVYELIQKQRPFEEMNGTYELKNNDKGVLSLTLINYAFSGGAHGNTIVKALNFDVETGHIYTLPELFKPGSHYVQRISEIIKAEIKARDLPTIGEFTEINPNQDFYIADRSLVIFFQLYEITPYFVGIPYFPISIYALEDIINEKGPLQRMF
ncbi:MAG: DUF3298 and DUF4163 domain-containing protein [Tissierellia bacterium]|nr:DUF3298 and DUF4163 domain-containing protein [Tissierellia bacterium]